MAGQWHVSVTLEVGLERSGRPRRAEPRTAELAWIRTSGAGSEASVPRSSRPASKVTETLG